MKLGIMSLVVATGLVVSCGPSQYGTTTNGTNNIPTVITTNFEKQYPSATEVVWGSYDAAVVPIDWELTDWTVLDKDDYVVTFNTGTDKYYAWYDSNGDWVGTAYVVNNYKALPVPINEMLNSKYNGYTIEMAQKEMWKDRVAYEVRLKNGDSKTKLLVDADGNIIKQKNK